MKKILIILGLLLFPQIAEAQSTRNPCVYLSTTNNNCVPVGSNNAGIGNSPMPVGGLATAAAPTYVEGKPGSLSFDLSGALRTTASGGGGGSVTQGTVPWIIAGQGTAGTAATGILTVQGIASMTPISTTMVPSASSSIGITPVVSSAAEATHVLKASAGNLYAAYATNLTSNSGFLVILNATSAPADGAITPLACAALAPNGVASINYSPGPPGVFSTGITAVVTGATTCFTKTTTGGTAITAFISGSVQ